MAVAEIFLSAFITVLFEKLASSELTRLARSAGICSELDKWSNTLTQIQAVLVDAGQKHITQTAVRMWLNKLHHLAYDIDDVLDDLATEAMRRQLNQQNHVSTSKVLNFIPNKFHALKYGRKMSYKLDEITSKLSDLVKEINILGLMNKVERSSTMSQRSLETSLVDVSGFVGREGDKEVLLEKLLGNEPCKQNVSILSIIGLGGIGKTTLARVLYNEKKVKDHFELMAWVCVSEEYDIFNISKAIFQAIGGKDQKFANLNLLQVALKDELSNRRFLLVLDDVWNEDYKDWELLQRPFVAGASGSKIVVTTRKTIVASVMDSVQTYPLELLSNDEALCLFAKHALGKRNFDSHPKLKLHGEGIIKKCGGLPLALMTLGRVLRTKANDIEWEELLNSEIWNVHNEGKILPALRLSYYDLPPLLKQLFGYCCLFPKDYLFEKDELVLLWMAEGFLYKSNGHKSMESLGRDCFEELESRSFFQHSTNHKSQYIMHDLISDLAMSVAGEFFLKLDDKIDVCEENEALDKFHHFSFIRQKYGGYRKFKALERAKRLRTFLATSSLDTWQDFYLSNNVLIKLLPQLHFIRVLSLANFRIREVPQSIGSLKHMRYLNFSNTGITCLPEQIGELYNLQSLLVSGCCSLSSLPDTCIKLRNLRHLDISNTPRLNKIPVGIGRLTSLQTLSKVIIGGTGKFKISDLSVLVHLQGQLSIKELNNVRNAIQAKEAHLDQKKGLRDMEMEWSDDFNDSRNGIIEYEVLKELRPYDKLKSLKILYYMGTKFPSWVGDPSFVCLSELTLRGCKTCTCLPTLAHLPLLQKLFLESMNGMKRLGSELLGPANSCHSISFPSLEVLEFKDMEDWEEWSTDSNSKGGNATSFPCLREISIINCPELNVVAIDLIPSLRVLHIQGCPVAVITRMVGVSSSILRLKITNIKGLTQLYGEILKCLRALEFLRISECDELTYLCESEAEACKILVSLQRLELSGCVNLVSLVERKVNFFNGMRSIREVQIFDCPKLRSYNCPNSIENLGILCCGSMTSLTFPPMHDLPSTLKVLSLWLCDNLEANWLFSNFLSSLTSLAIYNAPNLRLFPEGCLVHLTYLTIYDCDNIETIPDKGFGFLPLLCLRSLHIENCNKLRTFPHEHLQSLESLVYMWISTLPSLDDAFPSGLWPPNLSELRIGELKKPMSEWGIQHFPTSLVQLQLQGKNSGVFTFAEEEEEEEEEEDMRRNNSNNTSSFFLPSSLISLRLLNFEEVESVKKGMQHLTCLEQLHIFECPKLRDLPETLLSSLLSLDLSYCGSPKVSKMCGRRKGKYWHIISQIPHLEIMKE